MLCWMRQCESYMLLFAQTAAEIKGLWMRFSESFVQELRAIMPGLIDSFVKKLKPSQPSMTSEFEGEFDSTLKPKLETAVGVFMEKLPQFCMPALKNMQSPIASPTGELSWNPKKVIRFEGLLNFAMQLLRYILCGESELTASPDFLRQFRDAFASQRDSVVQALGSFDALARDLFTLLVSQLIALSLACLITSKFLLCSKPTGYLTRSQHRTSRCCCIAKATTSTFQKKSG